MMKGNKKDFPVGEIRRFLEPGPVILVSSFWKGKPNIMSMGWHMVMGFEPSLVGCYVWNANHSFELIRQSRECVINIPTAEMAAKVVGIGNCSGRDTDKFSSFKLTPKQGEQVKVPLIGECYANFECKVIDTSLIKKYSLFILEVVKGYSRAVPKYPQTLHYRGEGLFMISGPTVGKYRKLFKLEML